MKEKLNMKPQEFRAAVFDLDGTLLDTLHDIAESMNRVLERRGLPPHPLDSYRYFVGDGAATLVKRVLPRELRTDRDFMAACLGEFLADYRKNWDRNARLYPGIARMLNRLASAGIQLAVLSNKPHDFARLCVEKFMDRWHFSVVFGERPGIKRKPAPDGALEISRIMNVEPERCIYLGDTSIDMKTAVQAGMFPTGVLWGFREKKELVDSGARLLISRPEELLVFLGLE